MTPLTDLSPGTLIVLIGCSGSGKTTYAAQWPPTWTICLDDIRAMATNNPADQTATPVAAHIQDALLDARLARRLTTIIDTTAVHPHVRAGHLARARYWQRPCHAVLFTAPLDTCIRRDAGRDRTVGADIITAQHQLLPTAQQLVVEGFTTMHQIDTT